ncbi:MAG: T9SS type A sorting domain-containing protein [Bacteroidota bacterium]
MRSIVSFLLFLSFAAGLQAQSIAFDLLPKYVGGPLTSASTLEQPIAVRFTISGLEANTDYDQLHMGFLGKGTTSVRGSKWTVNGWISPSTQLFYKKSDGNGTLSGWAFLRTPSSFYTGIDTSQIRIRVRKTGDAVNITFDSDPLTSLNIADTATGQTTGSIIYGYLDSLQYGGLIAVAYGDNNTRPLSSWFVLPGQEQWTNDFFKTRMDTVLRKGGYFQMVVPTNTVIGKIELRDTMNTVVKTWTSTQWTSGAAGSKTEINFSLAGVAEQIDGTIPESFTLEQNYPNPFNPETMIRFAVPQRSAVRLTVYNALGQKIITLYEGIVETGTNEVRWNGTDRSGNPVSSGVYLYRLETDRSVQSKQMLLIK